MIKYNVTDNPGQGNIWRNPLMVGSRFAFWFRPRAVIFVVTLWCGGLLTGQAFGDFMGHGGMVRSVAISPNGQSVLTTSFDYSAKLWDFQNQTLLHDLAGHDSPVNTGAFIDNDRAATVGDDGMLVLWDVQTGKQRQRIKAHDHKIMALAVSLDARLLATGGWDRRVHLWDAVTGQKTLTIAATTPVNAVAFVGGGQILAIAGHDGAIRLHRLSDGLSIGVLSDHRMAVTALVATGDDSRLVSAGIDKTIRIWGLAGQKLLHRLDGHDGPIYGLGFSDHDGTLFSAGRDGFVMQWDLIAGIRLKSLAAHKNSIWGLVVSSDGRFVLTAGSDETVRVWHWQTGDRIGETRADSGQRDQPWLTSKHPGAAVYRSCAKCHATKASEPQRSGPHFENLFGRKVGTLEGYRYSEALKKADFIWTRETVMQLFRDGPDVFLPGTKMPVQKVTDTAKLESLVDYMEQLTKVAPPDP